MRIISQCRSADVLYESVIVFVDSKNPTDIYAKPVNDCSIDLPLGVYNSKEDAKFVLQYFSAAYLAGINVFETPSAEAIEFLRQVYLADKKQGESIIEYIKRNIQIGK